MGAFVLVADSDPFNLRLLAELCSSLGHEVMTAAEGDDVLDAVARQCPDLLLMEAELPGTDGLQVLSILKADGRFHAVPVLIATPEDAADVRERALAGGAEDYVARPYRPFEVQKRIRNALRLSSTRPAGASAPPMAVDDPITGAGTHMQLTISLDYEFTRAIRYGRPLSCVVVRCTNYATIAAGLGDAVSDVVMAPLSRALLTCIRGVDHIFRSSPHEFTILLPETGDDGCRIVLERLDARTQDPGLFDAGLSPWPALSVTAASHPPSKAQDGDALWREAAGER